MRLTPTSAAARTTHQNADFGPPVGTFRFNWKPGSDIVDHAGSIATSIPERIVRGSLEDAIAAGRLLSGPDGDAGPGRAVGVFQARDGQFRVAALWRTGDFGSPVQVDGPAVWGETESITFTRTDPSFLAVVGGDVEGQFGDAARLDLRRPA